MEEIETKKYVIDASGRTLGRVASDAAMAMLGKRSVHFVKYRILPMTVIIKNAHKLYIPERRISGKEYVHYTGYPGGLRTTSMKSLLEKKGIAEALRRAIYGMIPGNKLRKERMKRLIITDYD